MSYTTGDVPVALGFLLDFYKGQGSLESLYKRKGMEDEHAEMYACIIDAYKWL